MKILGSKFSICFAMSLFFVGSFSAQNNIVTEAVTPHFRLNPNLQADDYMAKTVIFAVKPSFRNLCTLSNINDTKFQQALTNVGTQNLVKKHPNHKAPEREYNAQGLKYADLSLTYEMNYSSDLSLEKVINALLSTGLLTYAEPHYIPKIGLSVNDPQGTSTNQYNIYKTKCAGTTTTGWDISIGDTNTVIGITDTGVDPTHVDLINKIKKNYADPVNGLDDDLDGYIDNFAGWDLGLNDNDPTWQGSSHGVHTSGTAAAQSNNGIGVAGVGYKCMFLPVKIANAAGTLTKAYEGITYAADHGCKIISCSWGGAGGGSYGQSVVTYATINKDALVIASAGNDGFENTNFPCSFDYVISVANTKSNDIKDGSSTWAYSVDVCAPGNNINSTLPGNTYGQLTGTSMSAPCAAGISGIIRSYFPTYTALQTGARLKQTTDNIYGIAANAAYINKLGTGRVNLYNALNNAATPYMDLVTHASTDNNDDVFLIGDTLYITGNYINYFSTTANVTGTLTASGFVTSIDNTTLLGTIGQNVIVNNNADPFKFKINTGTPVNSLVNFTLNLNDGTLNQNFYFSVNVNVDYVNITINDLLTTTTSLGHIGWNDQGLSVGLGVNYNSIQLLAEAGLMVGTSATAVSDCIRGATTADADFASVQTVVQITPTVFSDFDTKGKFNDNPSTPPLNLNITHASYAWATPGNRKYVIFEYKIRNAGSTTINGLRAGLFADYDIDALNAANNKAAYDAANKLGYIYDPTGGGIYAGIKLLTASAPANFYTLDNVAGGGGGVDANTGGYSTAEKWTTLSTQRLTK